MTTLDAIKYFMINKDVSLGKEIGVHFLDACSFMTGGEIVILHMSLEFEATFQRNSDGSWSLQKFNDGDIHFKVIGLSKHGSFSDRKIDQIYNLAMLACPHIVKAVQQLQNLDLLRQQAHLAHVIGKMKKLDTSKREIEENLNNLLNAQEKLKSELYAAVRGELPDE